MRQLSYAAIALMGACTTFGAYAAEDANNPCSLIDWKDFQSLGAEEKTAFVEAGWHQEPTPKELPGSQLFTNMCAGLMVSKAGRSSITLSFDSFKGKVNEQQIGEWLKTAAATAMADAEPDTAIVKQQEATCETGQYELPTRFANDTIEDVLEHYIACDQQVGTHHVSLNINVPDAQKNELPSPAQAKQLLDKSIARMKQTAFSPPDKRT